MTTGSTIPQGPLLLGLAGLLPFIWGAVTVHVPALTNWGQMTLGGRFVGPYVQLFYGAIILSFMSGVLWGFATKGEGWISYALSTLPTLWAFFTTGGGSETAAVNLIVGFGGLLLLDWYFWRLGLAPAWWMSLRLLLTTTVILTLLLVLI